MKDRKNPAHLGVCGCAGLRRLCEGQKGTFTYVSIDVVRNYGVDAEVVKVFWYLREIKKKRGDCIRSYNIEKEKGEKKEKKEKLNLSRSGKPSQPLHPPHGEKGGDAREKTLLFIFFEKNVIFYFFLQ